MVLEIDAIPAIDLHRRSPLTTSLTSSLSLRPMSSKDADDRRRANLLDAAEDRRRRNMLIAAGVVAGVAALWFVRVDGDGKVDGAATAKAFKDIGAGGGGGEGEASLVSRGKPLGRALMQGARGWLARNGWA